MEDYRFKTDRPLFTTKDTMDEFLINSEHFHSVFSYRAMIELNDGSYAEVEDDGKIYAVHASGDGDFFDHLIRFEIIS